MSSTAKPTTTTTTAVPAGPPIPTFTPEYAAESNTAQHMGVLTVFQVLAFIFVALRVYARAFVVKSFGKDDITMVAALVGCLYHWFWCDGLLNRDRLLSLAVDGFPS